ncbi:hypothetical protein K402DRAFT_147395 [Aulographum hederae CBS 113979]|uniref:Uncharacterized protein n=1 Tax=Aulographum hederae CBS 113979 TaxID=1176131 RepID=A0A6G1GTL3_9PEZI|nr:hypothetical protein K402DRAFT_147395 [Aulographum hederae CBS 113979]
MPTTKMTGIRRFLRPRYRRVDNGQQVLPSQETVLEFFRMTDKIIPNPFDTILAFNLARSNNPAPTPAVENLAAEDPFSDKNEEDYIDISCETIDEDDDTEPLLGLDPQSSTSTTAKPSERPDTQGLGGTQHNSAEKASTTPSGLLLPKGILLQNLPTDQNNLRKYIKASPSSFSSISVVSPGVHESIKEGVNSLGIECTHITYIGPFDETPEYWLIVLSTGHASTYIKGDAKTGTQDHWIKNRDDPSLWYDLDMVLVKVDEGKKLFKRPGGWILLDEFYRDVLAAGVLWWRVPFNGGIWS